ncbi:MAG: glycoside hydrolase family 13 protein [Clostridia bacterium]|jgi:4-alpha-glucanotransferase|nr:glycoside hydrolase family 13 protein [Clostridia bacterium]
MYHDSHDLFYREPFGAVPCNTAVTLRLKVAVPQEGETAYARFWQNNTETIRTMRPLETKEGAVYEVVLNAGPEPGLFWYYFYLIRQGKILYYGNNAKNLGGVGAASEQRPPSWQITVYHPDFHVPDWFKHQVMYQIFVDRFYNGNQDGVISNPKPGSLLHGNWEDTPLYVREPDSYAIRRWNFFGGNLAGIIKKLPYLKELGVGVLYLNPIFEASSNHKYDTGDYLKVDPMFGTNETFRLLCQKAQKYGIRIILDGVFSHTGADSIYFNREGCYDSLGAYQSKESPYYKWYRFSAWPHQYESWWGVGTLPNVEETEPTYQDFIMDAENSVVRYWLKQGAAGWRLDVADELPDFFIKKIRRAMKETSADSILIGEVWEDASHKVSYGETRAFLWGEELDTVMNYPFRRAVLDFMLGRTDAAELHAQLMSLYENYPKEAFFSAMNLLGSHDVVRILTLLGEGTGGERLQESEREKRRLSFAQRRLGLARLKILSLLQVTFPGVPCIYYGDEVGMEGYSDPYNRGPYPWGKEERSLTAWYRKIIAWRNELKALREGTWLPLIAQGDSYGFLRVSEEERIAVIVNRNSSSETSLTVELPPGVWRNLLGEDSTPLDSTGALELEMPPLGAVLLMKTR